MLICVTTAEETVGLVHVLESSIAVACATKEPSLRHKREFLSSGQCQLPSGLGLSALEVGLFGLL